MVISCSAYGCTNRWSKECDLTFHRFPLQKQDLLKQWVTATKRKGFTPTRGSFLCGNHFLEEDYLVRPGTSRKHLKPEAVPSQFAFPTHLMPKEKKQRRQIQKATEQTTVETHDHIEQFNQSSVRFKDCGTQTETEMVEKATETCNFLPDVHSLRRKVKSLQEKVRRREKKNYYMKDIISALKEKGHLTEKLHDFLNKQTGTQVELVCNLLNNSVSSKGNRYKTEIKMFAMSVYFYSPKAYEYLQTLMPLPHKSLISRWAATVNCEPGFLDDVFQYFACNHQVRDEFKDSSLIVDSMAIRKQVVWDQGTKKYTGFVDFGGEFDQPTELKEASEALVFMLVSIKGKFKCPVAYFLVNGFDANMQAKLINSALQRLSNAGIRVWAVTCDGTKTNVSTLRSLGCCINFKDKVFSSQFPHPDLEHNVNCILDMCHLVKLARNALAEVEVIESVSGLIKWQYIGQLNELQIEEGMTFANKLSGQHINYANKKMNVSLAVQTLSSSVADTIDFLRRAGNPRFQGSEATVEFLRFIDRIFDVMNSRNPLASGYKSSLKLCNQKFWLDIFDQTETYIRGLKINGVSLLQHPRNTFAFGILFNMQSIKSIALEIMSRDNSPLQYLLTYKFSQDHIELFFSCVRSRGGWNNNPNAYQLKCAMRKLLLGSNTNIIKGNAINFNMCSVVPAGLYDFRSQKRTLVDNNTDSCMLANEIEKWCSLIEEGSLFSTYKQNILYYIAGYVALTVSKQITCNDCLFILRPPIVQNDATYASFSAAEKRSFTKFVSRGKLIETSNAVYSVVEYSEKLFQMFVVNGDMRQKHLITKIVMCVLNKFAQYSFPELDHDFHNECGVEDLHETQLVRRIASRYIQVRLKTYGKRFSAEKIGRNTSSVRQKLSKLILFSNV